MSRKRPSRSVKTEFAPEYVPGHQVLTTVTTAAPVTGPHCRPCAVVGDTVRGTRNLLGAMVCAEHHAILADTVAAIFPPVLTGVFCKRCARPVTFDRKRIAREIELYGHQTGVCTFCFDDRRTDTFLPPPVDTAPFRVAILPPVEHQGYRETPARPAAPTPVGGTCAWRSLPGARLHTP